MKSAKKDRPKAGTFEQSRPGLAPRTYPNLIISNSRKNASLNLDGKEVLSLHDLGLSAGADWRRLADQGPVPRNRLD